MATAYFSLGGNMGNREEYLSKARQAIKESFSFVRFSAVYETEPVDFLDQPWFLNQVAEIQTDLPPESLLEWALSLESRLGRQRNIPKGPRTLDIDILLYDQKIMTGEKLTLPHPELLNRRHVLVPLAELEPDKKLPLSHLTIREALENVKDRSQVKQYASS
ncbi:MAG TPA: 2-amino-4-hydroxy-6-hydroxymethyldihydropteridine diphosphokinase [bacterium]|nr:2-amino-4-hydroxy-6-hydroxymethyldihydropteridine diphosphokinase [bacterium]